MSRTWKDISYKNLRKKATRRGYRKSLDRRKVKSLPLYGYAHFLKGDIVGIREFIDSLPDYGYKFVSTREYSDYVSENRSLKMVEVKYSVDHTWSILEEGEVDLAGYLRNELGINNNRDWRGTYNRCNCYFCTDSRTFEKNVDWMREWEDEDSG